MLGHLLITQIGSAAVIVNSFNSGFENSGNVPDGNTSPWSDTRALSGITEPVIDGLKVRLNLFGGYNGDLYGYLSYNGVSVVLLNRVGVGSGNAFGYSDSGINVSFSDGAANNIHFYQAVSGYSISGEAAWQPDGRTINPITSSQASFDATGTMFLSAFNGMNPNGSWTLVLADVSGGGGQTTVQNWGLDITAVPEPIHSMGIIALGLLSFCVARARNKPRTLRR